MTTETRGGNPAADSAQRRREQRGWYFYDWAAQPMFTSVTSTFGAVYLSGLAQDAAKSNTVNGADPCVGADGQTESALQNCAVDFLGFSPQAGNVWGLAVTVALVAQFLVLPIAGAISDGSANRKRMLAVLAFIGAASIGGMALATGANWELAAGLYIVGRIADGAAVVVYYSFLFDVADPDERDAVSSRGWGMGYLGGAIALAVQLVLVTFHDALGLSQGDAVRVAFLMCGLWWAAFTLIPLRLLTQRSRPAVREGDGGVLVSGFRELGKTAKGALAFPITLWFLGAYLVYNDGVATVINVSAQYGSETLRFDQQALIVTIQIAVLVAFVGAFVLGKIATFIGAKRTILGALIGWVGVVTAAYFLEPGDEIAFWLVAAAIGFVMGGTQALSRSLFSQLIPPGREGQYFGLYEMTERGTSWMGPLVFVAVGEATGSFRPAILALSAFFVIGFALLLFLPVRRGIREAGNAEPELV